MSGYDEEWDPKIWNPRFLAYCRATGGAGAQATLARDRKRYPGGVMCGFILWLQGRWSEWDLLRGQGRDHVRDNAEITAFDAWVGAITDEAYGAPE